MFTQYLEQINERLDGFARQAGYADAQGVLTDVQKAVDHDKKLRDQMMKEMNALFAQMRLGLEQRDKAAGAKGTERAREDDFTNICSMTPRCALAAKTRHHRSIHAGRVRRKVDEPRPVEVDEEAEEKESKAVARRRRSPRVMA